MKPIESKIADILHEMSADDRKRLDHPEVTFEDPTPKKVIAHLRAYKSGTYTKLAQNLEKIETLTQELKDLKDETKTIARDDVAALFSAEDAAKTRVVKTMSYIFEMTKDPAPTTTYKYAAALEEFQDHLTPELVTVLKAILEKHKTVTQKEPALKLTSTSKAKDLQKEAFGLDKIKSFVVKVMTWARRFDKKLARIEKMIKQGE